MRRKDFTSDFRQIQDMVNNIKMLNESIFFEDDEYMPEEDGADMYGGEMSSQMPMDKMGKRMDMQNGEPSAPRNADEELEAESSDPNSAVNRIREIALKGMVALCNTPEDPQYEVLKKVFSLIDKANDKKNEEREQGMR